MPEPRAQRTLVKSPPELWAELSDLEALARHLGEFGEIRITRLEPETTVAWEGDRARGTVELEPAGWGTKVTITAELAAAEAPTVAIEVVAPEPVAAEPVAVEPVAAEPPAEVPGPGTEEETPARLASEPDPPAPEPLSSVPGSEPEQAASEPLASMPGSEPERAASEPEPRGGFFARLFGRRKGEQVAVEAEREPEPVAEPELEPVAEPEPVAVAEPEPVAERDLEPVAEPEPLALDAESLDGERAQAILAGVLDDLGSAHHRPFSRG
jgi:hypothetical protein